jgi:hypothetical protein
VGVFAQRYWPGKPFRPKPFKPTFEEFRLYRSRK